MTILHVRYNNTCGTYVHESSLYYRGKNMGGNNGGNNGGNDGMSDHDREEVESLMKYKMMTEMADMMMMYMEYKVRIVSMMFLGGPFVLGSSQNL